MIKREDDLKGGETTRNPQTKRKELGKRLGEWTGQQAIIIMIIIIIIIICLALNEQQFSQKTNVAKIKYPIRKALSISI